MNRPQPSPNLNKTTASFGLAQMGALGRLGIVLPAIAMIWVALWFLVQP